MKVLKNTLNTSVLIADVIGYKNTFALSVLIADDIGYKNTCVQSVLIADESAIRTFAYKNTLSLVPGGVLIAEVYCNRNKLKLRKIV